MTPKPASKTAKKWSSPETVEERRERLVSSTEFSAMEIDLLETLHAKAECRVASRNPKGAK